MTHRPILFSAPMIQAILAGKKSQTRRIMKSQPYTLRTEGFGYPTKHGGFVSLQSEHCLNECPYGNPGDRLWVRETWTGTWHPAVGASGEQMHLVYAADGSEHLVNAPEDYVLPKAAAKPSNFVTPLFMPRWASRITLEITEVRVQRLQEISEDDCKAEGVKLLKTNCDGECGSTPCGITRQPFIQLWESINGADSWTENPFVWAVSFQQVSA